MSRYLLAIDQGTTSTRSIVFDDQGAVAGVDQREFAQSYPELGWVEHDPETIWRDVVDTARAALAKAGADASAVAAIPRGGDAFPNDEKHFTTADQNFFGGARSARSARVNSEPGPPDLAQGL